MRWQETSNPPSWSLDDFMCHVDVDMDMRHKAEESGTILFVEAALIQTVYSVPITAVASCSFHSSALK